jgi:ketosteroid isomerase-like protein
MSQENMDSIREANDAINRQDEAGWLAFVDPDAVMVPARQWPEKAPVRGADAIWDYYAQVRAAWEEGAFEIGEIAEAQGNALVVNVTHDARGRTSGATVQFSYWAVIAFRRGKQVRTEWFGDRDEALEAAGLLE